MRYLKKKQAKNAYLVAIKLGQHISDDTWSELCYLERLVAQKMFATVGILEDLMMEY